MIIEWRGDVALGDREAVAAVFKVSEKTVRNRCQAAHAGYQRGTRRALYRILDCKPLLKDVVARPEQTATAARLRALGLTHDGRPLDDAGQS